MQTFRIQTWSSTHKDSQHQFFLLSRGNNTGKPLDKPCPNCYVVACCSAEERERLYWLSYVPWQSGTFRQHLIGSVIEFIRIDDLRKLMQAYDRKLNGKIVEFVTMLTRLNAMEASLHAQLTKTKQLKLAMAQTILNHS
jgi:hypothetical protein